MLGDVSCVRCAWKMSGILGGSIRGHNELEEVLSTMRSWGMHLLVLKVSVALRPQRTIRDREPRTSTSTFTHLLSSDHRDFVLFAVGGERKKKGVGERGGGASVLIGGCLKYQ